MYLITSLYHTHEILLKIHKYVNKNFGTQQKIQIIISILSPKLKSYDNSWDVCTIAMRKKLPDFAVSTGLVK